MSADKLAGTDPTKEALWRVAGLHSAVSGKRWEFVLEAYSGQREQEKKTGKWASGHADLGFQFLKILSGHLRYDMFDPNQRIDNDMERQASVAFVLSNKTKSSNIIIVGTKVFEEGKQVGNDEVRLIWSLSPSGVVRF